MSRTIWIDSTSDPAEPNVRSGKKVAVKPPCVVIALEERDEN